ncbi:DNA repair protein RecO [Candidatus Hydrogenedentota bacterium]
MERKGPFSLWEKVAEGRMRGMIEYVLLSPQLTLRGLRGSIPRYERGAHAVFGGGMALEKSRAIVLRCYDLKETSRIVSFITPDWGLLKCVAKGARRAKSGLAGVLMPFTYVELVFSAKRGRDLQTVTQADILAAFPHILEDLDRIAAAAHMAEVAGTLAQPEEACEALFGNLLQGMNALDEGNVEPLMAVLAFDLLALGASGFAPEFGCCTGCGAKDTGRNPRFSIVNGGVVCVRCTGEYDDELTAGDVAMICRILEGGFASLSRLKATKQRLSVVLRIITAFARHCLERDLKTVSSLFKQV